MTQLAGLLAELNAVPEPIAREPATTRHREDRYIPSRKLKHLIRARTARCCAPGCGAQAITSEIDHTTPYPAGPTCEATSARSASATTTPSTPPAGTSGRPAPASCAGPPRPAGPTPPTPPSTKNKSMNAADPWGFDMDDVPGAAFHAVTEGTAWLCLPGRPDIRLLPGDVALLPTGTAHVLASDPAAGTIPFDRVAAQRALAAGQELHTGCGEPQTRILCASYSQDPAITLPLLALLPDLLHIPAARAGNALGTTLRLLAQEIAKCRPRVGRRAQPDHRHPVRAGATHLAHAQPAGHAGPLLARRSRRSRARLSPPGCRLTDGQPRGRVRGNPKRPRSPRFPKRVSAWIWLPRRVSTMSPLARQIGALGSGR